MFDRQFAKALEALRLTTFFLKNQDSEVQDTIDSLDRCIQDLAQLRDDLATYLLQNSKVDEAMFIDWILNSESDFATFERKFIAEQVKREGLGESLASYLSRNIAKYAGSEAFVQKLHSNVVGKLKRDTSNSEADTLLGILEFAVEQMGVLNEGRLNFSLVYPEIGSYFDRKKMISTVDVMRGNVAAVLVPSVYSSLRGSDDQKLIRKSLVEVQAR